MYTCYSLISEIIFYILRALKAHYQEIIWKDTGILV